MSYSYAVKKGKKRFNCDQQRSNKNAIDGWVSQIRYLLTMMRKAIHLDGREERASIDPSRVKTVQRATD